MSSILLRTTITVLTASLAAGCADLFVVSRSIPVGEIPNRLGSPPDRATLEKMSLGIFRETAIDPDSVMVRRVDPQPIPGWANGGLWGWVLGGEGWFWTAQINGKNRFGGYVGWEPYRFLYNAKTDRWWWGRNSHVYPYRIVGE